MPKTPVVAFAKRQISRLDARIATFLRRVDAAESRVSLLIMEGVLRGNLWQAKERRRLRAETQAILRELFRQRDQAIPDLTADHFLLGNRIAEAGLRESISQSALQKAAMKVLEENLVHDLGGAIDTVGRRVDDIFRKEGLRAAVERVGDGDESLATRRMRERLVRDGITSFVDSSGRRWTLSHYTSMAVKTVTSEAQNTATKMALVERGFDVVEINSVVDPCNVCILHDGKEFSLTGSTPGLPILKDPPPFHGSCRHFMFPNERTLEERGKLLVPKQEVVT